MALTFDTAKAVQRLRGPLGSQEAAEAVVEVIAEAQQSLTTKSYPEISFAHLEKRVLMLLLLQTAVIIGAVAAIEVLVGS